MKKQLKLTCKVSLLLAMAILAGCNGTQRIYVSPQGDDAASGSKSHPVQTIQQALALAQAQDKPTQVLLRGGVYETTRMITLANLHDLTLMPYGEEKVTLCGGKMLTADKLQPITDPQVRSRLKAGCEDQVRCLDLHANHIPVAAITPKGFGHKPDAGWSELYVNGKALDLARWPNDHEIRLGQTLVKGRNPKRGTPVTPDMLPMFAYQEKELNQWARTEGTWLWGYYGAGYADEFAPVADVDTMQQSIRLGITIAYGLGKGEEAPYLRWCMKNVLEELDQPGEYVLDSQGGKMYLISPDEEVEQLMVSVLDTTLITMDQCSNVRLERLTLEGGRMDGVHMHGCNHCVIDGCTLRNFGRVGLHIAPGVESRFNGIRNSHIYNIGSGGVELFGGDRQTLTHGECFVENCILHDFNRLARSYRPGVKFGEAGNRVSHVEIYNAPSMAILFNGNDQLIEYADIHHVAKEVVDQAAIYYGRNPSERGLQVRYLYLHDVINEYGSEVFGIYHDDGACGLSAYGCVFDNITSWAVEIGGGSDISYHNCVFMNMDRAIHIDDRLSNWMRGMVKSPYKQRLEKMKYNQPPFSEAYPELAGYFDNHPERPQRIVFDNNVFYHLNDIWDDVVHDSRDYLKGWGKHNWETNENPGFVDENDPSRGLNLTLIRQHIPDFEPIPFDEIGAKLNI